MKSGCKELNSKDLDSRLRGNDSGESGNESGRSGNDSGENGNNSGRSDNDSGESGNNRRENGNDRRWCGNPVAIIKFMVVLLGLLSPVLYATSVPAEVIASDAFNLGPQQTYCCQVMRNDHNSVEIHRFLAVDKEIISDIDSHVLPIENADHVVSAAFAFGGKALVVVRVDSSNARICHLIAYRYWKQEWEEWSRSEITVMPSRNWRIVYGRDVDQSPRTLIGAEFLWKHSDPVPDFSQCRIAFRDSDQAIYCYINEVYQGEIARWSLGMRTWVPHTKTSLRTSLRNACVSAVVVGALVSLALPEDMGMMFDYVAHEAFPLLYGYLGRPVEHVVRYIGRCGIKAANDWFDRRARRWGIHPKQNMFAHPQAIYSVSAATIDAYSIEEDGVSSQGTQTWRAERDVGTQIDMTPETLRAKKNASFTNPVSKWDTGHWVAALGPEAMVEILEMRQKNEEARSSWLVYQARVLGLRFLSKVCRSQKELLEVWQSNRPILEKFFSTVIELVARESFNKDSAISQRLSSDIASLFGFGGSMYYSSAETLSFSQWWQRDGKDILTEQVMHQLTYSLVRECSLYYRDVIDSKMPRFGPLATNYQDVVFAAHLMLPLLLLRHSWGIVLSPQEFQLYIVACIIMHVAMRGSTELLTVKKSRATTALEETLNIADSWGYTTSMTGLEEEILREAVTQKVSRALATYCFPEDMSKWLNVFFAGRKGLLSKMRTVSYFEMPGADTIDRIQSIIQSNEEHTHEVFERYAPQEKS